ncbi:MAG: NAD(P)H-hydrate dehydratase [Cytophagales bacterium]|nr:NAD(P)H-hydrate dehydratase [Bernardetiaceae bacterium]MDW8211436.1 NAD(P)H-hydrate dehydratase [Cytophagales bacterium]
MKVLSAQQIKQADAYTIAHEPISSLDLMERAATAAYRALLKHLQKNNFTPQSIHFFCGKGNNGGDGLVMARLLSNDYKVHVWICPVPEVATADFTANLARLQQIPNVAIHALAQIQDLPLLSSHDLCIDCIFGSGLNRPPAGFIAQVIAYLNQLPTYKVAIDIPSGLFADKPVSQPETVFRAHYTITFELPKLSFLFDAYYQFTGMWEVVPIGLHKDYIENAPTKVFYIDAALFMNYYRSRSPIAHKGNFGHGLLIAGSAGKIGAAVLAAQAALRSGIGLLTVALPQIGLNVMQTAVPEAMCLFDVGNVAVEKAPNGLPYQAIGIGPGMGQEAATAKAIEQLLAQSIQKPMVWDADALNLLAKNPHWWQQLPANSILTPHPKEFERISSTTASDFERHQVQLALSEKYRCIIVLKGATSCITTPEGLTFFNSTGNPGMATGGSGDVLTGIITSLLAQGYDPIQAAVMGVYLHGLAGDLAAEELSQEGMTSKDIVNFLPAAWKKILHCKLGHV